MNTINTAKKEWNASEVRKLAREIGELTKYVVANIFFLIQMCLYLGLDIKMNLKSCAVS